MVETTDPASSTLAPVALSRADEDRNIRNLYLDVGWQGLVSAGIGSFISYFLVRLGASDLTIGLFTALPALVAILLTVPAASLVEGRRDLIRVVNLSRLGVWMCYLFVAIVPFLFRGSTSGWTPAVIVGVWALAVVLATPSGPGWTAVFADVVPIRRRPVINGQRLALNSAVIAIFVAVFGRLLDAIPFPLNYQILFSLSFVAGLISNYYFGRIKIPEVDHQTTAPATVSPLRHLASLPRAVREQPAFQRYLIATSVYRLGQYLPAALLPIFWVKELRSSDTLLGIGTTALYGTMLFGYFLWGRAASKIGYRRVLLMCSFGLCLHPVALALSSSAEWRIPVCAMWGIFGTGLGISLFEGLLEACPRDQRASFVAVDATFTNVAAFAAPLLGTALVGRIGFQGVFFAAAEMHLLGAVLFYLLLVARRQPLVGEWGRGRMGERVKEVTG